MLGAVPGAVVGVSLLSAFNRSGLEWVYDHWSIVTLSCVARFGWMGVLACELLYRGQGQELIEQAQLDGTTRSAAFLQILVPANRPLLFGVCAVVALLSLQEVASTSLVRPPSFTPIAHVMIEKFHRFEDDMLISLSTGLNLAAIVVVVSFGWAIRKGRDRYGFRLLC
jgi:ABC-type Fe3+ transport system permease subunit